MAFFIVSISLILEMQPTSIFTPDQPTIIIIEEHRETPISHAGDYGPYSCEKCHFEPVSGECVDCHVPDYWIGDDNSIYFAHHDLAYTGFMDCWDSNCHNPDPEYVRYVTVDIVEGNDKDAWHIFCEICHDTTHDPPET